MYAAQAENPWRPDRETVEAYAAPFRERGGRVLFLELEASRAERLRRNVGASRLAEKPSKRDLESSGRNLLDLDARHRLSSGGAFDDREDWLRIDNTRMPPAEVAGTAIAYFGLRSVVQRDSAVGGEAVEDR